MVDNPQNGDNLDIENESSTQQQDLSNNWEHKYNSLKGRLAPTQRRLSEVERDLERERKEKEELLKAIEAYSSHDDDIKMSVANKKADELINSIISDEEKEELDPTVIKLTKNLAAKILESTQPSISPVKQSKTSTAQNNKSVDEIIAERERDKARARLNKLASNPNSGLGKAVAHMNDDSFKAWLEENPVFQNDLAAFVTAETLEDVVDNYDYIEKELNTYFSKKPTKETDKPVIDVPVNGTGIDRHLDRSGGKDKAISEIKALLEKHNHLVRSPSEKHKKEAKKIMATIDELQKQLRKG